MKSLFALILAVSVSHSVLACKRSPLSNNGVAIQTLMDLIQRETSLATFSIAKIERTSSLNYTVTLKESEICKALVYEVWGNTDCTIRVKKLSEAECG